MWQPANKKGVSVMVGYILLIVIAVVIGAIVYSWMSSYVPAEELECPDSVSISANDMVCETNGKTNINITVRNTGKFSVGGFFAFSGERDSDIANLSISDYEDNHGENGVIILPAPQEEMNGLDPNDEFLLEFVIDQGEINPNGIIELVPLRFQEENGRERLVNCGNARIRENLVC